MKDRKTGGLFPTALLLLLMAVFTLGGSAASVEAAGEQAAAQDEWTGESELKWLGWPRDRKQ